ncbi:MAG: DUF4111 domain-containing protein [Eubacterium sp.]|nr:DUF4111 domain-containing protein [Eubacterium sp.]
MLYQDVINDFTNMCKDIFSDDLTGVYLHGSLAMGCFNPNKSDIDIIVVIENEMTEKQKMSFMNSVVKLNEQAPPKGIEVSIVKKEFCKPFVYPTRFELHFSIAHLQRFKNNPYEYIEKMNGIDKDLAAHFMIINQYGIVLYGKEIAEVFGKVQDECYIDSIWEDVKNAKEDILISPVYVILNLCRVAAFLEERLCLSKVEGGKWAIRNVNQKYKRLILSTLQCYETDEIINENKEILLDFAEEMIEQIKVNGD